MPKLFVHIGTPKTGSTAIQYFLAQNKDALDAQGVNFVRQGRKRDAHNLVLQARRKGDIISVMRKVVDEIMSRPDDTHILTSEMYFGAGIAADLAAALPDELRARTKILAYLRRQDRFLEALYKQRVKTGRAHCTPWEFINDKHANGNYLRALAPYAEQFGLENVIVRPFERSHFPEGNIVHDAARIFGITGLDQLFVPGSIDNLTLSLEISQLLAHLSRGTDVNIKDVIRHLSHNPPADAVRSNDCYTLEQRREIMANFTDINEEIRATYTPDLDQLFDMSNLAPNVPDDTPDPADKLLRLQRAQTIVFDALAEMKQARARVSA